MSEIQTISQGNYLLSNLDAQKLYAQSPLTTGVSGASAYIGIEPSARYNETVLWSATANNEYSATLNEPYSSFERVRVEFLAGDTNGGTRTVYNEFPGYDTQFNLIGQRTDAGGVVFTLSDLSGSDGYTKLTPSYGRYMVVPKTTTAIAIGNINIALNSIVGINRKENV